MVGRRRKRGKGILDILKYISPPFMLFNAVAKSKPVQNVLDIVGGVKDIVQASSNAVKKITGGNIPLSWRRVSLAKLSTSSVKFQKSLTMLKKLQCCLKC